MEGYVTGRLPDRTFWRGRRVFLTGHTGFKGSWLALWLEKLGAIVTGFSLSPEMPSLCEAAGVEQRIKSIRGDIRDLDALRRAMLHANPDVVLHLAAQALVRYSYEQPVETFATNVLGTANLLEAARLAQNVQAVVVVTTDKCYENREWPWPYRESDSLGGHDPYSASKACAEILTAAWRRSFFGGSVPRCGLATARAGNVIGGGDWSADRLVPDCIRAFIQGQAVAIRNPAATRPWQHVLEPLCGYLILSERLYREPGKFGQAFNFGPNIDHVQPVTAVVDSLAQAWGPNAKWHLDKGNHVHEAGLLAVDSALARASMGWRPRLDLKTALMWTGRWYREYHAGADAADLLLDDINQYESLE